MDLFNQDETNVINLDPDPTDFNKQELQGYDEIVKEFIIAEKRYLRDLHMITKVFRDRLAKHEIATTNELEAIFRWVGREQRLKALIFNLGQGPFTNYANEGGLKTRKAC